VEAGISGIPRTREWDAVAAFESDAGGDECVFVLTESELIVLAGSAETARSAAELVADQLPPPYRAVAHRREGDSWVVGAVAIEVAELPADTEGEELMLTVTERGERALEVDGHPALVGIEALERAADARFPAYVLRARRIRDRLWEIGIDPL
jgi:hypothetical protein